MSNGVLHNPNPTEISEAIALRTMMYEDLVLSASEINPVIGEKGDIEFVTPGLRAKTIPSAESQYLNRIEVPVGFFHKCSLVLKTQILHEFHRNRRFMLRCERLGHPPDEQPTFRCRAVLGPQYPTECDDQHLFPKILQEMYRSQIQSTRFSWDDQITELQCVVPNTNTYLDGQHVGAGITVTNSETGHSSLWIAPHIYLRGGAVNLCSSRGDGISRFIHRGTLPTATEIEEAMDLAKRVAQIGIIQYHEASSEVMKADAVTSYLEELTVLPRRFANVILAEVQQAESMRKAELLNRILDACKELPLLQSLTLRREAGKLVGLFENTASRMANLANLL